MAVKKHSNAKKTESDSTISQVLQVSTGTFEVCVLGATPMICNRVNAKIKRLLLLPAGRKDKYERLTTLKHVPYDEYRDSPYRLHGAHEPTTLAVLASAFKRALCTTAIDLPGASKAQVGRLVWVDGELLSLFGVPRLYMAVVRNSDMAHTPDIRTRAILPRWACRLTVRFVTPLITAQAVGNLLAAAGLIIGIGDWRGEKGGNHGRFTIVDANDPQFLETVNEGGRVAQLDALATPVCYDDESQALMEWYFEEVQRRRIKGLITAPPPETHVLDEDPDEVLA